MRSETEWTSEKDDDKEGDSTGGLVRKQKKQQRTVEKVTKAKRGDPHVIPHRKEKTKDKATTDLLIKGIKENRFCRKLSDEEVAAIVEGMQFYEFEENETIVFEGDNGAYFFVAQDGFLEVSIAGKVVNTLKSGDAFGAIALLYNCPRSATVTAKNSTAGIWGAEETLFRRVLQDHAQAHLEQNRAFLDQMHIFDGLPAREKEHVGQLALLQESFEAGSRVITEDDPANALYFVKEGELSFMTGGSIGSSGQLVDAKRIGRLKKGDCFGWRAVLYQQRQQCSVVCDKRSDLVCVGTAELRAVLGDEFAQELERTFILSVLKRIPSIKLLPRSQLRELSLAFEIKQFEASAQPLEDTRIVIVCDGEITGQVAWGRKMDMRRGSWCQDAALNELTSGEEPFSPTSPSSITSPRDGQDEGAAGIDTLAIGSQGCRLATLSAEALARALTQVCPSHRSGVSFSTSESVIYLRKVILSKKIPIFQELSADQTDALVNALVLKSYRCGDKVFTQGEVGNAFYVVASGEVSVQIDGEMVRCLGKNACFGERAVLFNEKRTATIVVSTEEAEMWSLEKETFSNLISGPMREALVKSIQLQNKSVTLKLLKHVRLIGAGSFGSVRLVEHKRTGMRYALKRIRKKEDGEIPQEVKQECELLEQTTHPFILRLVTTFTSWASIYILTELITGGQMYEQVLAKLGVLNRKAAQFYMGSLCLILEALHDNNIVYRDLKPENVMLDMQGYLKLVDFGLAKKLSESSPRTFTLVGTLFYMAPEVIRGHGYGIECDIWSLGVMFFELVCGYLPFGDDKEDEHEILSDILDEDFTFPSKYTDSAGKRLIKGLLEKDVGKRLGICGCGGWEDIKTNKFFKAGVSGNLFQQISGRELTPPLVPTGEAYTNERDLDVTLSDSEELGKDDPLDIGCRILNAFQKFDLNGDGLIDRGELETVLGKLNAQLFTPEVISQLMDAADTNKDGRIHYDEFVNWVFSDEENKDSGNIISTVKEYVELDIRH